MTPGSRTLLIQKEQDFDRPPISDLRARGASINDSVEAVRREVLALLLAFRVDLHTDDVRVILSGAPLDLSPEAAACWCARVVGPSRGESGLLSLH